MVLPSDFASMSVPVQLLNLANIERVDRGMTPILGLAAPLNQDAQTAAVQNRDPLPTHFYGNVATGNWAAGYDSTLEDDFAWMYDDGPGSDNLDCTNSDPSGCWGHRHDILWRFDSPIAMGAGSANGQYGPSVTQLFVGGDTRTGAGQPDAPVVRPEPVGGVAASGGGASATGHAAAGAGAKKAGAKVKAWAGPARATGRTVRVTAGCKGPNGRSCTLRLTLTIAGRSGKTKVLTATARVRAGHHRALVLALGPVARRMLRYGHARLVVRQGGRVVLDHGVR